MNIDKEVIQSDIWVGKYAHENIKTTKIKWYVNFIVFTLFCLGIIIPSIMGKITPLLEFIILSIESIVFLVTFAYYILKLNEHKVILDEKATKFLNTILEFSDGALIPRYMFIDPNETTLNKIVINPNRDAHVVNEIEFEVIDDMSDENLKLKAKIDACLINYGIKSRTELGRMVYEKGKLNQAILDNESERAYEMYFKEIHQQQQQVLKNEPQSYNELDLNKVKHKLDNAKSREIDDMKKANDENNRIMQEW